MARLLDLVMTNVNCEIIRNNSPLVKEDVYHRSLISFHKLEQLNQNFLLVRVKKHTILRRLILCLCMIHYYDWIGHF